MKPTQTNPFSIIRIATKEAKKSNYTYRLGAIVTKGHRVLSTGFNKLSYCSVNKYPNSRHAEMDAILKLLKKPNGLSSLANASIYVSRIGKNGKLGLAKPCFLCMNLIKSVGIKEVIFTTSFGTERIKI